VTNKVRRLMNANFDEPTRPEAERLLEQCRHDDRSQQERLQLAIIKLSHNDIRKLAHLVEDALNDPRDILYWAEYPDPSDLLGGDQPRA
jgi:Tfp pilus assembly protein PilF